RGRLMHGDDVHSIFVMDNLDLIEKTFNRNSIFDKSRRSMHTILCMAFQYKFLKPLSEIITEDTITDTPFQIGTSAFVDAKAVTYSWIFRSLMDEHKRD